MANRENHINNQDLQPWLDSLKGMQRAQAPDRVFARVMDTMRQPTAKIIPISRIGLAAACLIALVGLNISVILLQAKQKQVQQLPLASPYATSATYGFSY